MSADIGMIFANISLIFAGIPTTSDKVRRISAEASQEPSDAEYRHGSNICNCLKMSWGGVNDFTLYAQHAEVYSELHILWYECTSRCIMIIFPEINFANIDEIFLLHTDE